MIARLVIGILLIAASAQAGNTPGRWWDGFASEGFAGAFSSTITGATVVDGALYACGDFRGNGATPMMTFAKWEAGQWQPVADEPPFQTPAVVAMYEGQLISNGVSPSWVPGGPWKWNGTNWEVLGEGLLRGYLGRVEAWAIYQDELVVVGDFGQTGNYVQVNGIARWDGTSWSPLGGGLRNGAAYALEVFDGDLYVGGSFEVEDDTTVVDLARWDGTQWSAVTALDPLTGLPESGLGTTWPVVHDFAVHDGKLVVAGEFDHMGAMAAPGLVLYDPSGVDPMWEVPVTGSGTGKVARVESSGGRIYASRYTGTSPGAAGSHSFEYADGGAWHEVPDGPNGRVTVLAEFEGVLQVGGSFSRAAGLACDSWVQFDGSAYLPRQNSGGHGVSGRVSDLHLWQGNLLAVGDFASAGTVAANGIAVWDGSSWSSIGGITGGEWGRGGTNRIEDAWVDGNDVYIVGDFAEIDGMPTPGIARYDGVQWNAYSSPTDFELQYFTEVIAWGGKVYAGAVARANSDSSWIFGLAEIDGTTWQFVLEDFDVNALEVFGGELLVGGSPRAAPWRSLLAYDGASFTPVEDASNPGMPENEVMGLREMGGILYVLGPVILPGAHALTWDGTHFAQLGPSLREGYDGHSGIGLDESLDICIIDNDVFVVGQGEYNGFTVWRWDGVDAMWRIVDLGTDGRVHTALEFQGELYVGGDFALAGMSRSLHRIGGNPIVSSGLARFQLASVVAAPPLARAALEQNRPNPFNPRTEIRFDIPDGGRDVRLVVYDARGRVVKTLISGFRPAGPDRVVWDGTDDRGVAVASGTYLYLLRAGEITQARKMSLIR